LRRYTLENLREAMKKTKILCATMLDTRGPEIGIHLAPVDVTSFDLEAPKEPVLLQAGPARCCSPCHSTRFEVTGIL
jgi:pyruvate kinase